MAKLLDPRGTYRFTPDDQLDRPEAERIVYRLKVPTRADRLAVRRALAAVGARQSGWLGLAQAMREIVEQSGDAARLAVLDAFIATAQEFARAEWPDTPEGRAANEEAYTALASAWQDLKPLADLCAAVSPSFRSLRSDDAVYLELVSFEYSRVFLQGWDGVQRDGTKLPAFVPGVDGVPDALLEQLPPEHLFAIYTRVRWLRAPTEAEAGNSVSPSPGASIPSSSTTAPSRTADESQGTSPASAGPT